MSKVSKFLMPSVIHRQKCGTTAALIGAGGSLLSSMIGFGASENANDANVAMQRETNAQNYKMFHEQQDFAEQMWNKTNAYNSPEQVAQRLRDVGVNPLAVLSGEGSSMQTAGMVNSPSANPMVAPHVENSGRFLAEGVERSINSYFQNANQDADAKLKLIDLAFRADKNREDLNEQRARIEESLSQKNLNEGMRDKLLKERDRIDQEITLYDTVWDDMVKQYHLNSEMLNGQVQEQREKVTNQQLQNKYQEMLNSWLPKLNMAQLQQFQAITAQAYADANLKKQMTKTEIENTAKAVTEHQMQLIRKHNLHISANLEQDLLRANIEQVKAVTQKTRNSDNWLQNYSPLAGFTAGGSALIKAVK